MRRRDLLVTRLGRARWAVVGSVIAGSVHLNGCGSRSELTLDDRPLVPDARFEPLPPEATNRVGEGGDWPIDQVHYADAADGAIDGAEDAAFDRAGDRIADVEVSCETSGCPDQANRVKQLSLGDGFTCALSYDGRVRCWGLGVRLGYGSARNIGDDEAPASVGDVDVGSTVLAIASGNAHTCALLVGGRVRCWGSGARGQLGYGNTNDIGDDESPASAGDVDVGGEVIQLAAGFTHTCAVLKSGHVRCWGDGAFGQLGYGNTNSIGDDELPTSAGDVNIGGLVAQLSAANGWQPNPHTCALLLGGSVRCWGLSTYGELGYGNTMTIGDNESPASAGDVDVGGNVVRIAVGSRHSCAVLTGGVVRCWGIGGSWLGYANTMSIGDNETPASAGNVQVGAAVATIAASEHTCALLRSGAVRCWGPGDFGQLGYGNTEAIGDNETPAAAGDVDIGGPVMDIALGPFHTCAVLANGHVRCWGSGAFGELGYGNTNDIGDDESPVSAGDIQVFEDHADR